MCRQSTGTERPPCWRVHRDSTGWSSEIDIVNCRSDLHMSQVKHKPPSQSTFATVIPHYRLSTYGRCAYQVRCYQNAIHQFLMNGGRNPPQPTSHTEVLIQSAQYENFIIHYNLCHYYAPNQIPQPKPSPANWEWIHLSGKIRERLQFGRRQLGIN